MFFPGVVYRDDYACFGVVPVWLRSPRARQGGAIATSAREQLA
jgi:hypothetical protein